MLTKPEIEKRIEDTEASIRQFTAQAERTIAILQGKVAAWKEMIAEEKPEIHAVEPLKDEAQA